MNNTNNLVLNNNENKFSEAELCYLCLFEGSEYEPLALSWVKNASDTQKDMLRILFSDITDYAFELSIEQIKTWYYNEASFGEKKAVLFELSDVIGAAKFMAEPEDIDEDANTED